MEEPSCGRATPCLRVFRWGVDLSHIRMLVLIGLLSKSSDFFAFGIDMSTDVSILPEFSLITVCCLPKPSSLGT